MPQAGASSAAAFVPSVADAEPGTVARDGVGLYPTVKVLSYAINILSLKDSEEGESAELHYCRMQ